MSTILVADSSVLINLLHVERLETFARLPTHRWVIPEEVCAEVIVLEQRRELERLVGAGVLERLVLDDVAALTVFAELSTCLGWGESACIALAGSRGWHVACDERGRFRREAITRLGEGRILTTPELFVMAIRAGVLTVDQADADKDTLARRRFRMPFASFRDALES